MKSAGYVLITLSFLAGAYLAVEPPHVLPLSGADAKVVAWNWVGPMLVLGAIGVALARIGLRQEARHADALTTNMASLREAIGRIVVNVDRLDEEKKNYHPYELHGKIDELFRQDLATFVEARESIAHTHSLQAYAEVMNEFAAGERYLNRVWSASVDCWIDDCHEYMTRAREQFARTRELLERLG